MFQIAGGSWIKSAWEGRAKSNSGRANVAPLNWKEIHFRPQIIRMRCKVETYAIPKLWLLV